MAETRCTPKARYEGSSSHRAGEVVYIADRLQLMYNLWLMSQPGATRRQLLKALEVMKALTLADNYRKWIASNTVKCPNTRSASASRTSKQSKCIPLVGG